MKQILMATIMVALLLTLSIINAHGIAFAYNITTLIFKMTLDKEEMHLVMDNNREVIRAVVNYCAMLLVGYYSWWRSHSTVFGAGDVAHHIGLCP